MSLVPEKRQIHRLLMPDLFVHLDLKHSKRREFSHRRNNEGSLLRHSNVKRNQMKSKKGKKREI